MGLKKAFLILGLLALIFLLLSSEVTARDSKEIEVVEETDEVGDARYGKYPGRGGYGGGYAGCGGYGGGYPVQGGYGGGHPSHGGYERGYCRYRCCGRAYGRGCNYSYVGETVAAQTQDKTHN